MTHVKTKSRTTRRTQPKSTITENDNKTWSLVSNSSLSKTRQFIYLRPNIFFGPNIFLDLKDDDDVVVAFVFFIPETFHLKFGKNRVSDRWNVAFVVVDVNVVVVVVNVVVVNVVGVALFVEVYDCKSEALESQSWVSVGGWGLQSHFRGQPNFCVEVVLCCVVVWVVTTFPNYPKPLI